MTFLMKKKYIYLISHAAHTTKLKIYTKLTVDVAYIISWLLYMFLVTMWQMKKKRR